MKLECIMCVLPFSKHKTRLFACLDLVSCCLFLCLLYFCIFAFCFLLFTSLGRTGQKKDTTKTQKLRFFQLAQLCSRIVFLNVWDGLKECSFC